MKNILLIGLASLVLFGISAGLSVWLQMNAAKTADTAHGDDKDKKKKADDHGDGKPTAKDDGHGEAKDKPADPKAGAKDADRVEYRRLQMEVVAADLNGQMQDYDKLLKQIGAEMKGLLAQQDQLDAKAAEIRQAEDRSTKAAADVKKGLLEVEDSERANIARIAALADNMPPETTAGILQQLVDGGKIDTAVKVLASMKERTAAKVLAAVTDPSVPPLIVERLKTLKRNTPAATPP
jgi:flagellar motility protein MotE (MotC chaperone)